jgi:hypothetical protein
MCDAIDHPRAYTVSTIIDAAIDRRGLFRRTDDIGNRGSKNAWSGIVETIVVHRRGEDDIVVVGRGVQSPFDGRWERMRREQHQQRLVGRVGGGGDDPPSDDNDDVFAQDLLPEGRGGGG